MGKYINILLFIFITIIMIKFFIFLVPYALIIGLCLWVYFKYVKPFFTKRQQNNDIHNHYKEEVVADKEESNFQGPVIDVDYEEIEDK